MSGVRSQPNRRRGAAAVLMIIAMIVINLMITAMVLSGARDQDLNSRRMETLRAFYAAEAGMNMSIRELMEDSDEDGDGTTGSISDDANDANNPSITSATFLVELVDGGSSMTLTSRGSSGDAERAFEATTE